MTSLITTYVPSIEKFIDPIANKPFNEIPQSLFENCNHMTKNTYTQEEFEELRRLTTSTPEKEISDLCTRLVLKQYPNLPSKDLQQHIYRKKEELDWIYGLDKLEKDILKHENPQQALENALKTDQIIKYNGYFIRSTMPSESGKFRTQPLFCYKRDLTDAEVFTGNLLQVIGFQYGKNITHIKSNYLLKEVSRVKNKALQGEKDPIKRKEFERKANAVTEALIKSWIKEQEANNPIKNQLDIKQWLDCRYHFYPEPDKVKSDLTTGLEAIEKITSTIEKAAALWSLIVGIHISAGANKRTAFALTSLFLLVHGYQPPQLSNKDEPLYTDLLIESYKGGKGFEKFTEFLMKKIDEAQKQQENLKESKSDQGIEQLQLVRKN